MLIAPPAHIHALHVHYVQHQHTHPPVHDYGVRDGVEHVHPHRHTHRQVNDHGVNEGVEPIHEQGRLGGNPWTCAQAIGLGLASP